MIVCRGAEVDEDQSENQPTWLLIVRSDSSAPSGVQAAGIVLYGHNGIDLGTRMYKRRFSEVQEEEGACDKRGCQARRFYCTIIVYGLQLVLARINHESQDQTIIP